MTTVNEKLEKLRQLMESMKLDGVLLRRRRSFSWLTNGKMNYIVTTTEEGVADLLIFKDRAFCVTTKMELARIREEELTDPNFEWVASEWYEGTDESIRKLCQGKKIGMDINPAKLPNVTGTDLSQELAQLAYVLNPEEIEHYRWLSRSVAQALETTCRSLEPGMTEFEIQALLGSKAVRLGIQTQVLLVATDQRIFRYRHPIPTDKKLERYAMLVLCGEKWGLVANATRFVHFGELSGELQENKEKLAQIDLAFNLATLPGVPIREVFRQGIEAYQRLGHPEDWRLLHQGGPTGYASREFLANLESEGFVQCHQAFAWNPSLRGIKSEDTILATENGPEFLTHTGEWTYIEIEKNGQQYLRPDILVR